MWLIGERNQILDIRDWKLEFRISDLGTWLKPLVMKQIKSHPSDCPIFPGREGTPAAIYSIEVQLVTTQSIVTREAFTFEFRSSDSGVD